MELTNIYIDEQQRTVRCMYCGCMIDTKKMTYGICNCQDEHKIRVITLPDHVELTYPETKLQQLKRNIPILIKK
jgi:hypothetical protein